MLFDIIESSIVKLVIHHIGSHAEGTDNDYSRSEVRMGGDSTLPMLLKQYFFDGFREPNLYCFGSEDGADGNNVFRLCKAMFDDEGLFYENSRLLAGALFECSNHPNIRSGEMYVTMFRDVRIFDKDVRCIGIFKSEHRDTFLKVYNRDNEYNIVSDEGFDLKKLDKGCLVFDVEEEKGYVVAMMDKAAGKSEAGYWKNDFLGVETRRDNNYQTSEYMDLCKSFVTDVFNQESDVERTDQIDMLNRQVAFFKDNEVFNVDKFKEEVLANNEEICDAFDLHKAQYEETRDVQLDNTFAINPDIVKKKQGGFKSVIKLDKNFHIYVHGNRELVERGFDSEKRLFYYKLYFEGES